MATITAPKLNAEYNPGGARPCEDHGRLECTKNRTKGRGQCHAPAIRGTDACRKHGGIGTAKLKAKGKAEITAWSAIPEIAAIDPSMTVLATLQMTWVRLATYSELLRRQVVRERDQADSLADTDSPQASGLVGYTYGAAGKDGTIYAQSEAIRALVVLEAQERDRVVKYAKIAHDMGISTRMTEMAERWADVVASRVTIMIESLNLTPDQAAMMPGLITQYLGNIDMDPIERNVRSPLDTRQVKQNKMPVLALPAGKVSG